MSDNVPMVMTPDDETLLRLGQEIHGWVDRGQAGYEAQTTALFAIGRRLLEARTLLRDDQSYGRWFRRQEFGFQRKWANVLCRAAEREVAVRELMAAQKVPNIEAALKVVTQAERANRRELVGSQLPTEHSVLPSTITVACRDARDHYPGETADLAIFSPPYPDAGVVYDGEDDAIGLDAWLDLIATSAGVLSDGWQVARLCMVIPSGIGRSPYVPISGPAWAALAKGGFEPEGEIVWDKATTGNRTTWGSNRMPTAPRVRDRHEVVLVGRSQHEQHIPDDALMDDGTGRRVSPWLDQDRFLTYTQSVWQISPESAKRVGHPAPFPVELAERLLRLYGWPGCTVIDPFAGAGTVGEAARFLGATALLHDRSQAYCDLMEHRLGMRVAS
jgi:DNA modification methylase